MEENKTEEKKIILLAIILIIISLIFVSGYKINYESAKNTSQKQLMIEQTNIQIASYDAKILKDVDSTIQSPELSDTTTQETINEINQEKTNQITVKATAYCPCVQCSEGYGHNTASGKKATQGRTIAVDKTVIPLGTKVQIGDAIYVAEDVGGGVKGNHIDIFFDNHQETEAFGVQYITVTIL